MISYKYSNSSLFLILLKLLPLLLILYTVDLAASTCEPECGGVSIPFPFGIGKDCSHNEHYEIECRNTSRKSVPFLSSFELEVVSISRPDQRRDYRYGLFDSSKRYGLVRVKIPTISTGCPTDGKESGEELIMNLTGSPFFTDDQNSLVAVGCNSKYLHGYTLYKSNVRLKNYIQRFLNDIFLNTDTNECTTIPGACGKGGTCVNTIGGFRCGANKTKAILIGVGSGFGVLVLVVGLWWSRKFVIKRRVEKRKKNFFKRNGGLLLQQELSTSEGNVEKTRIFSSRELEKATENFSQNRVLGHGGQGTVYKGMLVDGTTVAVKKSKVVDEDKLQEFINEVVILSQINHRHVVKLLGCCLETEVPILVYEFILNGNLFQHIHEESEDYTMTWGMRIRIAVDIAGALSYLHSSASSPIYHRDIKSANILLDEKYRAKVADFGTSRSVTIDQTHWTTVVSGTVGYVDPEYYRSSQYTDKSDVYSFGVVLAELITGDKPVVIVQNTQEIVSLAEHFKVAMKEKRLSDIMDARIKDDCKPEQVAALANLALKCLSSKGKKRPNMREVFMDLERICISPEDSQVQIHIDEEDEEEEVRNMINKGDSWSVGMTAPALSIDVSPSSSVVEPLFPRLTW